MRRLICFLLFWTFGIASTQANEWRFLDSAPTSLFKPLKVKPPMPCPTMNLPAIWRVKSQIYADITGDGTPECILLVWRPWKNWPIHQQMQRPTPIVNNKDQAGWSSNIAVLKPLSGGQYHQMWVGSALVRPVISLSMRPNQQLVTLETTYQRGENSSSVGLSEWKWTGFGFQMVRRQAVQAREVGVDVRGRVVVR